MTESPQQPQQYSGANRGSNNQKFLNLPISNYTTESGGPLAYPGNQAPSLPTNAMNSAYTSHEDDIPLRRNAISPFCGIPTARSGDRPKRQQKIRSTRLRHQYSDVSRIDSGFPIDFMSFSQRRYHGFRNHVEFDKKRILLAGSNEFSIHGYENCMSDVSCELVRH